MKIRPDLCVFLCVFLLVALASTHAAFGQPDHVVSPSPSDSLLPVEEIEDCGETCGLDRNCSADCGSCCRCCARCEPLWTVAADVMALTRSTARRRTLFFNGPTELLNVGDLTFDPKAGPRVSIVRHGSKRDLEFVYFGIDGWNSEAVRTDPVQMSFQTPGNTLTLFAPFATMTAQYRSRLYSAELNLRRETRCGWDLSAGLRWLELEDSLFLGTPLNPLFSLLWEGSTNNHLYGFQVGGERAIWDRGGRARVDATLKAGIYYNHASQSSRRIITSVNANGSQTAFVGEIGLTGTYQLTDQLSVRAGYQLMWIEGVALAPNQIDRYIPVNPSIDIAGGLFYQGAFGGLEWVY